MNSFSKTIGHKTPNTQKVHHVTWKDLPLSCPMPGASLWNSHQRVYLPIHESMREQCPYCGTVYVLVAARSGEPEAAQPNIEIEGLYHQAIEQARDITKIDKPDNDAS